MPPGEGGPPLHQGKGEQICTVVCETVFFQAQGWGSRSGLGSGILETLRGDSAQLLTGGGGTIHVIIMTITIVVIIITVIISTIHRRGTLLQKQANQRSQHLSIPGF